MQHQGAEFLEDYETMEKPLEWMNGRRDFLDKLKYNADRFRGGKGNLIEPQSALDHILSM